MSTSCINGMEVVVKYLIGVTIMKKTNYKILFADLDGTLITTASGKTFPEGIWDMKLRFDTLEAIKKLAPKRVFIVSNQGGIEKGYSTDYLFTTKIHYVCRCIEEYCGIDVVDYEYCKSNSKSDPRRKPNTGMLQLLYTDFVEDTSLGRRDALMIGTNRVLKAYSIQMKQHLTDKIQEFKENERNDSSRASKEKEGFREKTKYVYP